MNKFVFNNKYISKCEYQFSTIHLEVEVLYSKPNPNLVINLYNYYI